MTQLSILIPSRNEEWLCRTVQDILEHIEGDTEIIVVVDGPSTHPIPEPSERVRVVQLPESIGQRAATNLAARMSEAKWVMKVDAHCAFAQGFDAILMRDMQPDWTCVPIMRNLWVFDLVCPNGHRRYQSTSGPCKECGEPTYKEVMWVAKNNPQSTSYCFDHEPHFQYFKQYCSRQEYKDAKPFTESMSLQGSCWMLSREKYWELDICEEAFGSWGSQGLEVAIKTWLSGGKVIVNHNTYYAHAFRTAGGDWGFPYKITGKDVDKAKSYARELFFNNKYPKQIRPLSWLIEKFAPVVGWHDDSGRDALSQVTQAGAVFMAVVKTPFLVPIAPSLFGNRGANRAESIPILFPNERVPILTEISMAERLSGDDIFTVGDGSQVGGIRTSLVSTDMVDLKPNGDGADLQGIHDPVGIVVPIAESNIAIPTSSGSTSPVPAASVGVDLKAGQESSNLLLCENDGIIRLSHSVPPTQVSNRLGAEQASTYSVPNIISPDSTPSKSILYYTDNRLDETIMRVCQKQLLRASLPIISVSLNLLLFGENHIIKGERGSLTMFRQILAGLEASKADVIFFAEHDCLMPKEHFAFTPLRDDMIYYDGHAWQVDAITGHALTRVWRATSGLCAFRTTLLEHYRKRVAIVEKTGFNMRIGYEPGSHHRPERIDDLEHEIWMSPVPYIDIRHDKNLTWTRWKRSDFRNKKYTEGWQESDSVPGWGKTEGRFQEFLKEVEDGILPPAGDSK